MPTNSTNSPLDYLRPLIPPDHDISGWPLAMGWWILLGIITLSIILGYLLRPVIRKAQQQKQIYRNTIKLLEALYLECAANADVEVARQIYLQKSNDIFKRAIHNHPRLSSFSTLTGKAWVNFLAGIKIKDDSGDFSSFYGDTLYASRCLEKFSLAELHHWACAWIMALPKQAKKLV